MFVDCLRAPALPGQHVRVYYSDEADPRRGRWHLGTVIANKHFFNSAWSIWDSVGVHFDNQSEYHSLQCDNKCGR